MDINLLSNLAMLSLVIGTIPSMYAVINNRNALKGFSILGCLGILVGQVLYSTYFYLIRDYITCLLTFPLATFWSIVLIFKLRNRKCNR